MVKARTKKLWSWVLILTGILILVSSHVWLLITGHLADADVGIHSWFNIVAAVLIVVGKLVR